MLFSLSKLLLCHIFCNESWLEYFLCNRRSFRICSYKRIHNYILLNYLLSMIITEEIMLFKLKAKRTMMLFLPYLVSSLHILHFSNAWVNRFLPHQFVPSTGCWSGASTTNLGPLQNSQPLTSSTESPAESIKPLGLTRCLVNWQIYFSSTGEYKNL